MDWTKKVRTKGGSPITLVLRPDQTRDSQFAYGYIEPGNTLYKWYADSGTAVGGHNHGQFDAVQAMTRVTLHINVYKNIDGFWETHAHESIEEANKHAGSTCWAQTAITIVVPEE
jgi:hypothetical protein